MTLKNGRPKNKKLVTIILPVLKRRSIYGTYRFPLGVSDCKIIFKIAKK